MKTNSISKLKVELDKSPELKQSFLNDPIHFINSVDTKDPIKDKIVFLVIVGIVGVVLLISIILGAVIIFKSSDVSKAKVPEFIVSIGSTALGAIVGLLAPTPRS
ncbi:hypothetical protein [Tenacibaculum sp. 190524A05c]|uniref:hypothetical protein n=1 Tax=Tenacibaculum platacis TaxID=3137852 RepID=UPI0032B1C008